ncbi:MULTISPECIES: hypothetical protein [Streptomyces]|nr:MULTISPECIES: hypothetical protein [Streptomyces]MYT05632.1 hypothetical protein [Streptomyces sp. SID5470]
MLCVRLLRLGHRDAVPAGPVALFIATDQDHGLAIRTEHEQQPHFSRPWGVFTARSTDSRLTDPGRKTTYGPFEPDATGVTAKRKGTLPWPMVEAINDHAGVVVVRQYGRRRAWAKAEVKTVPNHLVFLTVALNLCGR